MNLETFNRLNKLINLEAIVAYNRQIVLAELHPIHDAEILAYVQERNYPMVKELLKDRVDNEKY